MRYEDYIDLSYKPKADELVCHFYVEAKRGKELRRAIGAVAAESSIGTWTEVTTEKSYMARLAAKVFEIKKVSKNSANVKIAYPPELFEPSNLPNIMSSIAGNIFGMRDVEWLRLNDIIFPKHIAKSFKGPKYGIQGIRKITKVKDRPLIGTIIKPKIGLNAIDHAKIAYEAWLGGCDIVKDDENLANQAFNKFEDRLRETLAMKEKVENEIGEKKIYMINITAETNQMLRRARLVEDYGNEYAMVDIITVGWAALQTLRDADFNLVLHGHRAGHAAIDKYRKHGIRMKVIARLARLIGLDQLHIGTGIGKMFETTEEVLENRKALVDEFYGLKPVMPVASGGLHPLIIPKLYAIFGKDVVLQFGGGIHGHPQGTLAGARAVRQALNAVLQGIALEEYAIVHKELRAAFDKWKYGKA
ncbi:MAG: type III ribulose-bisphosphate carboxylase [Candidatus Pacearchaeota archaeon]